MTVVSTIYDAIISKVSTTASTYARLANPYSIGDNPALILKHGYGVAQGEGVNTERYVGCIATWQRNFPITLITQLVNTENDATGRASVEVSLDETRSLILKAFENDSTLGGIVIKAVIANDGGIEYIDDQQGKFLAMVMTLNVEYQESLT